MKIIRGFLVLLCTFAAYFSHLLLLTVASSVSSANRTLTCVRNQTVLGTTRQKGKQSTKREIAANNKDMARVNIRKWTERGIRLQFPYRSFSNRCCYVMYRAEREQALSSVICGQLVCPKSLNLTASLPDSN